MATSGETVEMAGSQEILEGDSTVKDDCCFEWDDASKLYFHVSSGFYHDPYAGWYYSSIDGRYYTLENERYVPLECSKNQQSGDHDDTRYSSHQVVQESEFEIAEGASSYEGGTHHPPSDWLEDTLIDLYLSGSSKCNADPDNLTLSFQTNKEDPVQLISDEIPSPDLAHNISLQHVEDEFRQQVELQSSSGLSMTDASLEEENWLAQYGMVVRSDNELTPSFPIVDLWDWEMVTETAKKRQPVSRLIGRLVKKSSKLHPSVPSGGSLFKTTAIQVVHLDLVRVSSGKIYRLRSPSQRYLASISTYDSSNPTRGWGFPDLYDNLQSDMFNMSNANNQPNILNAAMVAQVSTEVPKTENITYRDRAAERRMLHGFGIGPGQKVTHDRNTSDVPPSLQYSNPEEAAAEAMNMSFGKDSYARRIMENMGWKEGQSLGSSTKGILEPLQAVSNKGNAGLGWKTTSGLIL